MRPRYRRRCGIRATGSFGATGVDALCYRARAAICLAPVRWASLLRRERCLKKLGDAPCEPLEESSGCPRTVCRLVGFWPPPPSTSSKSCLFLPGEWVSGAAGIANAAIHSSDRRFCNCTSSGCTETELPPTRPLLQQTPDACRRAGGLRLSAPLAPTPLREERCARSAIRDARCADATDAVATARAPRWRARAATPSSSRPTTG